MPSPTSREWLRKLYHPVDKLVNTIFHLVDITRYCPPPFPGVNFYEVLIPVTSGTTTAAWQRGCLHSSWTPNRAILVTSCWPGNYFHPIFIFKLKWETNRTEYATNGPQLHRKQYCFTVSICHLVKVDVKTLESNCNWKNYLADSRFLLRSTFSHSSAFKMVASQWGLTTQWIRGPFHPPPPPKNIVLQKRSVSIHIDGLCCPKFYEV
jgi:hypothetical protein